MDLSNYTYSKLNKYVRGRPVNKLNVLRVMARSLNIFIRRYNREFRKYIETVDINQNRSSLIDEMVRVRNSLLNSMRREQKKRDQIRNYFDRQRTYRGRYFETYLFTNDNNDSLEKMVACIMENVRFFNANDMRVLDLRLKFGGGIAEDGAHIPNVWLSMEKAHFNIEVDRDENKLAGYIADLEQGNNPGSDVYDEYEDIDLTRFVLFVQRIAGANDVKLDKSYNHKTLKYGDYICISPRSNNDNCLLECIRYVLKNNGQKVQTSNQIRKLLKIPKGAIDIKYVSELEKLFKIKIGVISGRDDEGDDIYIYGSGFDVNNIELLLRDEHYSIIKLRVDDRPKKIQKKNEEEKEKRYFFFDYESVWNNNTGFLVAYSLYCYVARIVNDKFVDGEHLFLDGLDCNSKFVKFLCEKDNDKYDNILIGYNSARFDNYLLVEELYKKDLMHAKSMFIVNNSILDCRFMSYRCFDLCKFVPMSLKDACEAYNCKFSKLTFNHDEVQKEYLEGRLEIWLKNNRRKLKEYNKIDVLGLAELTLKTMKGFKILIGLDIFKYMTKSQMGYDKLRIINNSKDEKERFINPSTEEAYNFIRECIVAGRSQTFKRGFFEFDIQSIDVKSLYPYVMLVCEFPIGSEIKTDKYIEGKLGVYSCLIKKQPEVNIIPKRSKDSPLDWTYKGEIECKLTSIDIELIRKYGGEVIVYHGYYWDKKSAGVFKEFITPFKDAKTQQDELKKGKKIIENGVELKYNPAIREGAKNMMNDLSGKTLQNNFKEDIEIAYSLNDFVKFDKTHKNISISDVANTDIFVLKGEKKNYKYKPENVKPVHLGVFIYSYARRHMYESVISKIETKLQMDTDSMIAPQKEIDELVDEGRGYGKYHRGGEFGDFEDEIDFKAKRSYFVAPKSYGIFGDVDKKMRFKGISKRDRILTISKKEFDKLTLTQKYDLYLTSQPALSEELYKKLLIENKSVLTFSSRLERMIGKSNISSLKQKFMLKEIKVSGEVEII